MLGETAGKRLAGEQVSRLQSLFAAAVAALAAGVATYKLLRSGGPG